MGLQHFSENHFYLRWNAENFLQGYSKKVLSEKIAPALVSVAPVRISVSIQLRNGRVIHISGTCVGAHTDVWL
jgi:hypothetical protein